MDQVLRLEIAMKRLVLVILKKEITRFMRQDLAWLKERKESRLQDRKKKMELFTVTDDAEKAKGKRSGVHLKQLVLGWWIGTQKQMSKELNAKLKS